MYICTYVCVYVCICVYVCMSCTDMTKVIGSFPDCTKAPIKELILTFVHMKLDGFHLQYGSPTFLWQMVTTVLARWFTDRT